MSNKIFYNTKKTTNVTAPKILKIRLTCTILRKLHIIVTCRNLFLRGHGVRAICEYDGRFCNEGVPK